MRIYWTKKCIENGFRCPNCQCMIGDKSGQMPLASKNHKIQWLDGQIKCVVCNTPVGYIPHGTKIGSSEVRQGMTIRILNSVSYVTPIEQTET